MIGLLFLGLIALWFVVVLWLARNVARRLPPGKLRVAAVWILVLVFIALPLGDEIAGGFQMRALCKSAALKVDAEKIRGRRVRVNTDPANQDVDGTSVRVLYSSSSYRDAGTAEELASSGRYVANGGWLIRTLSTDGCITPLTFPSTCDGEMKLADHEFKLVK